MIGSVASLWAVGEARAIAKLRAALHHDSMLTLVWTSGSPPPLMVERSSSFQDLVALRGWLDDVSWSPVWVWRMLIADVHPPLHPLLVHLLRVAGWSFQTSFLTVNLFACLLMILCMTVLSELDSRSVLLGVIGVIVVVASPAVLRTASEPRHWMLATSLSFLAVTSLAWLLCCSLRCESIGWRKSACVAMPVAALLLTESSMLIAIFAWCVVAFGTLLRHPSRKVLIWNSIRVGTLAIAIWLVTFPAALEQYARGAETDLDATFSTALLVPEFDSERAQDYLRYLGDLWQMGGDNRVTLVLLWGTLMFLLSVQLSILLVQVGAWSGWTGFDFRSVTHAFVVGLVGSTWTGMYFVLYTFGYLPDHAMGWKYILPHGILLLVGIWDGVQRFPIRLISGALVAFALTYHSITLSLASNSQAALVNRIAASDRVVVLGNEFDLLQVMYPLAAGDFVEVPEVYFARPEAGLENWTCREVGVGGEFLAARRQPFAPGLDALLSASNARTEVRIVGTLEWQEIGEVVSC